jgi:hypothetical protein
MLAAAGLSLSVGCKGGSADATASAAASTPSAKSPGDKACCKGLNECKGKGGCAVPGKNDCAGKNECKGKGGCNMHCPK